MPLLQQTNLPSSKTANKSSNSSQSTVKRFSTKNPPDFLNQRTDKGLRADPGLSKSITCKNTEKSENYRPEIIANLIFIARLY